MQRSRYTYTPPQPPLDRRPSWTRLKSSQADLGVVEGFGEEAEVLPTTRGVALRRLGLSRRTPLIVEVHGQSGSHALADEVGVAEGEDES